MSDTEKYQPMVESYVQIRMEAMSGDMETVARELSHADWFAGIGTAGLALLLTGDFQLSKSTWGAVFLVLAAVCFGLSVLFAALTMLHGHRLIAAKKLKRALIGMSGYLACFRRKNVDRLADLTSKEIQDEIMSGELFTNREAWAKAIDSQKESGFAFRVSAVGQQVLVLVGYVILLSFWAVQLICQSN